MAGGTWLRGEIVARLCAQQPVNGELHTLVLGHLANTSVGNEELCEAWLYQEFAQERLRTFNTAIATAMDRSLALVEPAFFVALQDATKDAVTKLMRQLLATGSSRQGPIGSDACIDELKHKHGLTTSQMNQLLVSTCGKASRYEFVLLSLLCARVSCDSRQPMSACEGLRRVLQRCPTVPASAVILVRIWCADHQLVKTGLHLLKRLVLDKPNIRHLCLDGLLGLCLHKEECIRIAAISVVHTELHGSTLCANAIEEFATASLCAMICPEKDIAGNTFLEQPQSLHTQQHLGQLLQLVDSDRRNVLVRAELYLTLCSRKKSLIHRVMHLFIILDLATRRGLLARCQRVWSSVLSGDDPDVCALISEFPPDAILFVLMILDSLQLHDATGSPVVAAVRSTYRSRVHDIRLLLPFLYEHSKDELLQLLPELVRLLPIDGAQDTHAQDKRRVFRDALQNLFSTTTPPIAPSDLLFALHSLPDMPASLAAEAILVCLSSLKVVYSYAIVCKALRALVEKVPLSPLFMYTLLTACQCRPELKQRPTHNSRGLAFVEQVLLCCIERQIWQVS